MSRKRHTPADEPHFLVRTLAAEFPDGRALAPHAHSWGQLIYSVSGVMSVWTEQGSWVAPPHWAVWAPAGVAHSMRFTGTASLRTLYLRPGLAGLAANSAVIAVSPLLRELILRAVEIGFLDAREPTHAAMADLIVHELRAHSTPALDLPLPRSALLRRIAEHVAKAPDDRSGHATLAKRFGVGARTLEYQPSALGLRNVPDLTSPAIVFNGAGYIDPPSGFSRFVDQSAQFNNDLSWIRGRHSMKFGIDVRHQQFDPAIRDRASGGFVFDPRQTADSQGGGHAWASFLLAW